MQVRSRLRKTPACSHARKKRWIKWKYVHDRSGEDSPRLNFHSLLKIKKKKSRKSQPRALPCFSTSFKGSTPGERMKNMGVAGLDSSKETAKSSDLPITYLLPSFSSTKSLRGENMTQFPSTLFIIFDRQEPVEQDSSVHCVQCC